LVCRQLHEKARNAGQVFLRQSKEKEKECLT